MPYDDYEITVNIDNNMSENAPKGEILDAATNQGLVGADGKLLSTTDESKLVTDEPKLLGV